MKYKQSVCSTIGGGIGNQLFMYAAGRALAWRRGADLTMETGVFKKDTVYRREYLLDHFKGPACTPRVDHHLWPQYLFFRLRNEIGRRYPSRRFRAYYERHPPAFQPEVFAARERSVYLFGNWQCERYFEDCRERLLKDLDFDFPYSAGGRSVMQKILSVENPVAIHVRSYNDVPDPACRLLVEPEYVAASCANLLSNIPTATLFVFSDTKDNKTLEFLKSFNPVFVTQNQERGNLGGFEDLLIMSHCRHFIVSNSSFSWWGAWLSQKKWGFWNSDHCFQRFAIYPKRNICNADFIPNFGQSLA